MFSFLSHTSQQLDSKKKHRDTFEIWLLLLSGLLLRLVLAPIWTGYDTDVNTFMAWSSHAFTNGLFGLYADKNYFLDYPPGYMYVLYLIGFIHHALDLQWGSGLSLIILKFPAMLADLLLSYLLYQIARDQGHLNKAQSLGIAAIYVFNPAVWLNSTLWGQVDAFFMLFMLWSFLLQQKGKFVDASAVLALAILLKPQALLFGPFILIDVLNRRNGKLLVKCLITGLVTIVVMTIPFTLGQGYTWLFELYFNTLASYNYASLNAFNLFALLGGNFIDNSEKVFGVPYSLLGWVLMAVSLLYACLLYAKGKGKPGALFYISFLFITAVFMCTTKMHERYLYYGLLLALASFLYIRDRRILGLFIGFSVTHAINVADVFIRSLDKHYHIPRNDSLMLGVSAVNVLLLVYAAWLGWKLFARVKSTLQAESDFAEAMPGPLETSDAKNISPLPKKKRYPLPEPEPEPGRFFKKKDALYLGGLVLVYTIIALYHLGGHQDPETYWKPGSAGEAIVVDLGEPHTLSRINSFAGVGEGAYSYWFSMDGQDWKNQTIVKSDHTKVFTWNTAEPNQHARYVKIVTDTTGFYLHEVGIYGENGDKPLPIRSLKSLDSTSSTLGKPENVFDEQEVVPYTPTYMEGSYFDEIYHARTAYEHLHKIEPYESTHPPLGKIFISLGIWLFGLNPFGWRIVGTLFGVGMLPIMYVFAKRMFGKSEYAFIASFLMAFDFMHFAQTRISTIDVYGVFFIMLMFYYMYRYISVSFYKVSLRKTLVPLSLSGLFFGIGAASKWIVIYGGAGLAALLFFVLIVRYREYHKAHRSLRHDEAMEQLQTVSTDTVNLSEPAASEIAAESLPPLEPTAVQPLLFEEERLQLQRIVRVFPRYTLLTLLWCIVMFIIIPAIIYFLSYIPFMMVPGPGHGWKDVITYQKHIYEYHKNLQATHPFSSKWFEWPLMLRPIWYYQAHFMPEGKLSSIISFGNPLIWWPGFIAVLVSFYMAFRSMDRRLGVLLVAYCSQYLPWVLVPRLTFIYHYFAMVPFMILILTWYLKEFIEQRPQHKSWVYVYLGGVLLMFVIFYPLLSGMVIPKTYSFWLRWLPGWNYF
ncbi:glycosyltransferase family 39 protein [Paenibacillus sp. GP183]|uniref:glycosyltransferase family 39 protein n=1 Tax=Paenibacillus sp. GP183 TaxID=1882751 RepID=UPI000895A799|nr:glycosyltransferase family 39 protein [Paenibacillus sp. GP183]SEB96103.1 Mannosyltransferase related to Gpi18 [Paenibacillus sp. GP183]